MSVRYKFLMLAASAFLVAACESPETRAEKHFRAALAFVQSGDVERRSLNSATYST